MELQIRQDERVTYEKSRSRTRVEKGKKKKKDYRKDLIGRNEFKNMQDKTLTHQVGVLDPFGQHFEDKPNNLTPGRILTKDDQGRPFSPLRETVDHTKTT